MADRFNISYLDNQPSLRIKVFGAKKHIDLRFDRASFDIIRSDGNRILGEVYQNDTWRIRVKEGRPASYEYFLMLGESDIYEDVEKSLDKYTKAEDNLSILTVGGEIYLNEQQINKNQKHIILAGPFESERDARHHSYKCSQLNHCRIHRKLSKPAEGVLEIYDPNLEYFEESPNEIKIVPKEKDASFEIQHFEIQQSGDQKPHKEDLHYHGELTIRIDEDTCLVGINEIEVEEYLKGVLHSELDDPASVECAKCMAIVSRSQTFARFAQSHYNEEFDFCSESHCLRYYGRNKDAVIIQKALNETKGMVLDYNGKIYDTHFCYSCGGHTENTGDVWLNSNDKFSTGRMDTDAPIKPVDLTQESSVKEWILDQPEVFCRHLDSTEKVQSKLACDSFRWEVFYTRSELEKILWDKTGEEPGIIYEIIPIKRGVSGRIKEIDILGSLKNVRISGELNIRSGFSETLLNSSCFFIKSEKDEDGVPLNFMFVGAGKGHGVGLCKAGAKYMANNNKNAEEILTHYFPKTTIKRIY